MDNEDSISNTGSDVGFADEPDFADDDGGFGGSDNDQPSLSDDDVDLPESKVSDLSEAALI